MPDDKPPQTPRALSTRLPDEESRQIIKATTEVRKFDSEESERRQTPEGTYEKKTTRSEVHETKTTSSETFEPAIGAARLLASSRAAVALMAGLPPQVKMEVVGTNKPGVYDADFIMQEVARSQERCRWQVEFPSQNGLHRASLEAQPNADGTLALHAYLEGHVEGPHWSNRSVRDLSSPSELTFDAESGVTPSAGVDWPDSVSLTPLFEPVPKQGHFISPEPTTAEMAMMAMQSSSSSSGCTASERKRYYAGANKDIADLIGASAKITTNETLLDCEPDANNLDLSSVFTGVSKAEMVQGKLKITKWAQTGYTRYRNDGSKTIFKKRYAEVQGGPNIMADYWLEYGPYPAAGAHKYTCLLTSLTGKWTFYFDNVVWKTLPPVAHAGWIGKTGTQIDFTGEIHHKKTQMPGMIPDVKKCKFTECSYDAGSGAKSVKLVAANLIPESTGRYIAAEWGEELVGTQTDKLNIWDKKPPFS